VSIWSGRLISLCLFGAGKELGWDIKRERGKLHKEVEWQHTLMAFSGVSLDGQQRARVIRLC